MNVDMGPAEVRQFCELNDAGKQLMRAAMKQMHMSARAFHRILKLARTIADLAESEKIESSSSLIARLLARSMNKYTNHARRNDRSMSRAI